MKASYFLFSKPSSKAITVDVESADKVAVAAFAVVPKFEFFSRFQNSAPFAPYRA